MLSHVYAQDFSAPSEVLFRAAVRRELRLNGYPCAKIDEHHSLHGEDTDVFLTHLTGSGMETTQRPGQIFARLRRTVPRSAREGKSLSVRSRTRRCGRLPDSQSEAGSVSIRRSDGRLLFVSLLHPTPRRAQRSLFAQVEDPGAPLVTILREPVARWLSAFYYYIEPEKDVRGDDRAAPFWITSSACRY